MNGINCSQARAEELAQRGYEIYLSPTSGFYIHAEEYQKIYKTGDAIQEIPADAFRLMVEETLFALAEQMDISYHTLAKAAREGRILARQSGSTWLTTRQAIEYAISHGKLKPRNMIKSKIK